MTMPKGSLQKTPCCGVPATYALVDDVMVGKCSECGEAVTRMGPISSVEEYLGDHKHTTVFQLQPVPEELLVPAEDEEAAD